MMTLRSSPSDRGGGVIIDPARASKVLIDLMHHYGEKTQIYKYTHRIDAPQTVHRPSALVVGSLEHARWLFFAAMTDRREVSEMVYRGHNALWAEHANLLYNKPLDAHFSEDSLQGLLMTRGFGMPSTAARDWKHCSATLFTWLRGDPRLLYEGRTIDNIVDMKKRGIILSGFGPKILSLLAIFYAELDMIALPRDAFPVDVHVQRFALSTGIAKIKKTTQNVHLERALRPFLAHLCFDHGWSVVEVSHAIWLLGNRLCTGCSRHSMASSFCPAYSVCQGPYETRSYFKKGRWDHEAQSPQGDKRPYGLPPLEVSLFPVT